jgi:hypothetical protein
MYNMAVNKTHRQIERQAIDVEIVPKLSAILYGGKS